MSYGYPQQFTPPPAAGGYPAYKPMQQYMPTNWGSTSQVRPVTSLEEVKAYPIDFDGSVFYFPDNANKRIYTKFINIDGTVAINMYELKEINTDQTTNSSYVTRQEFDNVVNELKAMLEKQSMIVQEKSGSAAQLVAPMYQF